MSTLTETLPARPDEKAGPRALLGRPTLCFWVAGFIIYGLAAANSATGHFLDQTTRDLWQHLASLRELIANPFNPSNPFVPSAEGSRHFHPYWVSVALVARALGLNEWQAIGGAAFFSSFVLLLGIQAFARAFYRSPWGPLALLLAMAFSWSVPVSHTGYHSLGTLIEGFAYPAALLLGLSLLLWALVIQTLARPSRAPLLTLLAAFMMATHQLGAVIGFLGAGCFIAFWPRGGFRPRAIAAGAIGAGILLAEAWPYHSPIGTILRNGNSTWIGGPDFYSPRLLFTALVPSVIGIWGLRHRHFARRSLPVLAALGVYTGIYLLGLFGVLIATRFMMPAVLMLQIGVGALIIALGKEWKSVPSPAQLALFTLACLSVATQLVITLVYVGLEVETNRTYGSAYEAALELTRDVPDDEPVGAYDVAAWPVAATGQRVVSVPWPEPGISDLAARQAAADRLFDPDLSRGERLGLARHWGVKHLLVDKRGAHGRTMPPGLLRVLNEQSVGRAEASMFIRFDLE